MTEQINTTLWVHDSSQSRKKKKKKIKQRAHYKVCLLEEVCFHATERFQKIFEKKERCTTWPERRQKCYLQKPGCSEHHAVQGHSHTSPTPTNSQAELLSLAWTHTIANKQTRTVYELSYLFVFILTLLQRRCLKFLFHPEFWGDATETREGLWQAVQRPDVKRIQGASIHRTEPNTATKNSRRKPKCFQI